MVSKKVIVVVNGLGKVNFMISSRLSSLIVMFSLGWCRILVWKVVFMKLVKVCLSIIRKVRWNRFIVIV